jgi:hypothetical protein
MLGDKLKDVFRTEWWQAERTFVATELNKVCIRNVVMELTDEG